MSPKCDIKILNRYVIIMCVKCRNRSVEALQVFQKQRGAARLLQDIWKFVQVRKRLVRPRICAARGQCRRCFPIEQAFAEVLRSRGGECGGPQDFGKVHGGGVRALPERAVRNEPLPVP